MTSKSILRKEYINIRKEIKNRAEKELCAFNNILSVDLVQKSTCIAVYYSYNNELDTIKLIDELLRMNKIVCLPRIQENNEMVFYRYYDKCMLEKNCYGIFEPIPNIEDEIKKDMIDLMIVPGSCFDLNGFRVGYGKGYYDRFLEKTSIHTIGFCFDEQILENDLIDCDSLDIRMEYLVSDKRIVKTLSK